MNELFKVTNLTISYPYISGLLKRRTGKKIAVKDVSFDVMTNETVGIVGESGCGKTSLCQGLLRIIEPDEGKIIYRGKDMLDFSKNEMTEFRKESSIIFQNPYSSLNPKMRIIDSITEAPLYHQIIKFEDVEEFGGQLLSDVGLKKSDLYKFPSEFSGGERQRICIARALGMNPEFMICDEPVSSLDVSVQAQILNLIKKLRDKRKFSCIFISHDLSVIKYMADFIFVMYHGEIIECASKNDFFTKPLHPYTKLLLSSIPFSELSVKSINTSENNDKKEAEKEYFYGGHACGCQFYSRCSQRQKQCRETDPPFNRISKKHHVRCHLFNKQ